MNRYKTFLIIGIFIIILLGIYKQWFLSEALVGGDFGYLFREQFDSYTLLPPAWQSLYNLGYPNHAIIWTGILQHLYVNTLGKIVDYNVITLFGFLIPCLLLGTISSYLFIKKIVANKIFIFLGVLLYLTNTYILMVVGGGQILIALAYAIAPLVVLKAIELVNVITLDEVKKYKNLLILKRSIVMGLLLALQLLFDPRITYITALSISLYWVISLVVSKKLNQFFFSLLYVFFIPLFVAAGLHAVWILPTIIAQQNPIQQLGSGFSSTDAVRYFSFAKFENTISLLHPNWPDNIFGKTSFMKPEFIGLSLLAFASLLFITSSQNKDKKRVIVFFVLMSLIGAFLAKGANEPFGPIYSWMFTHIPGFIMFRDPTKFYLLVALSFSVLVPFSLYSLYNWIETKSTKKTKLVALQNIFLLFVVAYILFLMRPALSGQLDGTFKQNTIPQEYSELKDYIHNQPQFFRTLWYPRLHSFSFYSNNHPGINGQEFLEVKSLEDLNKKLRRPETRRLLQESGVKYIVIPFDSEEKLFLKDNNYDEKLYLKTLESFKKTPWLQTDKSFGKIVLFRVDSFKDHFWTERNSSKLKWQMIDPTQYQLTISSEDKISQVIFSETYDPRWVAFFNNQKVSSQEFHEKYNSFKVPSNQQVTIYYEQQQWVNIGLFISLGTLLSIGVFFIFFKYHL